MSIIFETERLFVKELIEGDLTLFHKMQSNYNVMRFVRGKAMTYNENKQEIENLIKKYAEKENDFWIFAVKRKSDNIFLGTVALVKNDGDDEIGYRLLEEEWGKGYGYEITKGLIAYCKGKKIEKIVAYAAVDNIASTKILKKLNFTFVKNLIAEDLGIPERKFELYL